MPPDDAPPDDGKTHVRVRIDAKLLARLEKERRFCRRTLTGEIIERLENSFVHDDITYAVSGVESEVSSVADELSHGFNEVDKQLKLMREELHQIRTELQELRRSIAPPPSTFLIPTRPDGEKE